VQIDGRAEIVDQPEALGLLVTVYRAAMIRDERVVIGFTPNGPPAGRTDAPRRPVRCLAGGTMLTLDERCSCCSRGSARVARATSVRG